MIISKNPLRMGVCLRLQLGSKDQRTHNPLVPSPTLGGYQTNPYVTRVLVVSLVAKTRKPLRSKRLGAFLRLTSSCLSDDTSVFNDALSYSQFTPAINWHLK